MENGTHLGAGEGPLERYMPAAGGNTRPYSPAMFSLTDIRGVIWRQRFILVGVVLFALAVGLTLTLLATPKYEASASVRVTSSGPDIVEGQEYLVSAGGLTRERETMSRVIQSRSMARQVVERLELHDNADFMGSDSLPEDERSVEARKFSAAQKLQDGLSAQLPPNTQIIMMSYTSSDPALAAAVVNGYAETFVTLNVQEAVEANSYARAYLEEQIAKTRNELRDAEIEAIQYARANNIVGRPMGVGSGTEGEGADAGTATTLAASTLTGITQTYTEARTRLINSEARWRMVANRPAAELPEVQRNSAVQSLQTRRGEMRSQLADLRQRYQDDYPAVRELISNMEELDRQIAETENDIKEGIRSEYEIARQQAAALAAELASVSSATLDEQDRRVQYNMLDRDVDALRSQLDDLLQRYNQITAATNLQPSNLTILDTALVPSAPSSPSLFRNMLVALIVGLGVAGGLAVLRETLEDRIRSIEDIQSKLRLHAVGQVPLVADGDVIDDVKNSFSVVSEAYASIRASIDYVTRDLEKKVLQFTSTEAAEGKTTSSLAIARSYAAVGRRVLLIDLDLRRPALHRALLQNRPKQGIVEAIYGHTALQNVVIKAEDGYDFLPIGSATPINPVEILSSGLVGEFLNKARASYDVILVDGSPVLGIADAPLLSRFVDGVIFIAEANRSPARQTRTALSRLTGVGANVIGVIVTKFQPLEAGENYKYEYSYYSYSERD
ncbi:GumC family protein [Aurantiacibacter zhengii]|uniref:non-specific protein-tyrosine kinase n=1 Tax=Aurantiacibacter zhengii TaxID=2307003 RepID=A0A418NN45_9SPHN|nr:polysaccharide biosynthesis tyrosine autokinase [Aurantiacibacter zhengii]RIV83038.1 polysaccharide biosynthesis tyrosine autokinase [Aurantiacibacter zhengii]